MYFLCKIFSDILSDEIKTAQERLKRTISGYHWKIGKYTTQQNFSSKFCHFSNAHNSVNFYRIKTIFFHFVGNYLYFKKNLMRN